jgi:hypothetical protein
MKTQTPADGTTKSARSISPSRIHADTPHIGFTLFAARSWESWLLRKSLVLLAALALPMGCASLLSPSPAFSQRTTSANLLTGDDASFDNGSGSWTAQPTGVSIAVVTSPVQAGTGALAVTTNAQGPLNAFVGSGGNTATWTPATGGARYTAHAFVRAASQARSVASMVVFYDGTGKMLASATGQPLQDATDSWKQTFDVVGIAPPASAFVAFGVAFYGTAQSEKHYLDSPSLTSTTMTPVAVKGPFHTQGNAIFGSDGARVVFRGIHRDHTQLPYPSFPSDPEIAQARAWGANVVRVPLSESLWLNTCPSAPTNPPDYASKLDSEVNSITSRGMLALLDLHFSVTSSCGTPGMHSMADAQYAPTFWSQVADRYKTNPMVAFDLYNEPHNISDAAWLNGGTVTDGSTTYTATGMQQLYDTVRAAGATNLVFTSGNNNGVQPAANLVQGVNIVNGVHVYTCGEAAPPTCATPQPYNPNYIMNKWTTLSQTAPVMVTESGWPDKNDGQFIANVIASAEGRGWGWIAFAWDGTTYGLFDLITVSAGIYEPSPAGMPVVAGLTYNGVGGIRSGSTSRAATTRSTNVTISAMRISSTGAMTIETANGTRIVR